MGWHIINISFLITSDKLLVIFLYTEAISAFYQTKLLQPFLLFFFFIAMQFRKPSLTEPYDIAIALKYVKKESLSDELKYRILKTYFKPDGNFTFPKSSRIQPVV